MNWGWPMAPAQEPRNLSRATSPSFSMVSAARSSACISSGRQPSAPSVASERITSLLPIEAP